MENETKISMKMNKELTAIISVPGSTLVIAGGILYTAGVDAVKFEVSKDEKGRYRRMLNMEMDTEIIELITDPQKISEQIEKLFVEREELQIAREAAKRAREQSSRAQG